MLVIVSQYMYNAHASVTPLVLKKLRLALNQNTTSLLGLTNLKHDLDANEQTRARCNKENKPCLCLC
jgi:hypothetical protein